MLGDPAVPAASTRGSRFGQQQKRVVIRFCVCVRACGGLACLLHLQFLAS